MPMETERGGPVYGGEYEKDLRMGGSDPALTAAFAGLREENSGRGSTAMSGPSGGGRAAAGPRTGMGRSSEHRATYPGELGAAEHTWRGGLLGWLGAGIRASAAWVGQVMQGVGARMGGTVRGGSAELGRALQGRGEQVGAALERRGERAMPMHWGEYPREGRAPRSYHRPDERILDDVYQRISTAGVDADDVEIEVNDGVVKLSGRVPNRFDKRAIEDVAEQVFGVEEVHNLLRVARRPGRDEPRDRGEILGPDARPITHEQRPEGHA